MCPKSLDPHGRDGPITTVLRYFKVDANATVWDWHKEDFSLEQLIDEMALLALAPKLVLPASTWAYWAGQLSVADEIHVDELYYPPRMNAGGRSSQFVYHNERDGQYFGSVNQQGVVEYSV